ncbi:hypothetical protein PSOL_00790 [Candidatus Phytoplasma solani]|uniref:hypothetical protein n=1 Tax=Candidatus Phytoplasma solani TaxID=69896 RepID=UPI0032DBD1D1
MPIVIKKKCQNGNLYIHYSNGKIKTIKKDGTIQWRTKKIKFYPPEKDSLIRVFFYYRKGINQMKQSTDLHFKNIDILKHQSLCVNITKQIRAPKMPKYRVI